MLTAEVDFHLEPGGRRDDVVMWSGRPSSSPLWLSPCKGCVLCSGCLPSALELPGSCSAGVGGGEGEGGAANGLSGLATGSG